MERPNYGSRAKQGLAQGARDAALVIVLLTAAVHAHATTAFGNSAADNVILPTGNFACSTNTSGDCSNVTGDAQLPAVNGIAGVSFFTLTGQEVSLPVDGDITTPFVEMSDGGTLNQPLDQNVPVSWDFTLSTTGSAEITSWTLFFVLGTSRGTKTYGREEADTGSGPGTFSGNDTITLTNGPALTSSPFYEAVLLSVVTSGTGDVVITAPFDVGATTPEPATAGTLAAGLGLLAWMSRRRKRA